MVPVPGPLIFLERDDDLFIDLFPCFKVTSLPSEMTNWSPHVTDSICLLFKFLSSFGLC